MDTSAAMMDAASNVCQWKLIQVITSGTCTVFTTYMLSLQYAALVTLKVYIGSGTRCHVLERFMK